MSVTRRNAFLAWLVVHLTLIVLVCAHDTLWLLRGGVATIPAAHRSLWEKLDRVPKTVLGVDSPSGNPWKRAVATYTHLAGIELGYGYFAPNIPASSALVFEFHYPDGRVEYETPGLHGEAGQFRVSTLVGQIGQTDYDRWRSALIKLLAGSAWKRHPEATLLRAFFGRLSPPTMAEYRAGKRERTFTCHYVYEYRRTTSADSSPPL